MRSGYARALRSSTVQSTLVREDAIRHVLHARGDEPMLVLTRGIDDGILIGDDIRITIVRVAGGVVRIGIEAPPEATIMRGELLMQLEPPDEEVDFPNGAGRR